MSGVRKLVFSSTYLHQGFSVLVCVGAEFRHVEQQYCVLQGFRGVLYVHNSTFEMFRLNMNIQLCTKLSALPTSDPQRRHRRACPLETCLVPSRCWWTDSCAAQLSPAPGSPSWASTQHSGLVSGESSVMMAFPCALCEYIGLFVVFLGADAGVGGWVQTE